MEVELIQKNYLSLKIAYVCIMAGIYVHIPFCRKKCNYCNFFSSPVSYNAEEFTELLLKEARLRSDFFDKETLNTLYIGGGSPAMFPPRLIKKLSEELMTIFSFENDSEITIEVNPDDVSPEWTKEMKQNPVNRISIGIQSFNDIALRYLQRLHNARQGMFALNCILDAGYTNVSIDLIYGIPGITKEMLADDLQKTERIHIPHISAYNLTVEPATALIRQIANGIRRPVSSSQGAEQFLQVVESLLATDYIHYEISNFCLPEYFSKHNTSYWKSEKYLGLGPSAHSFNGNSRMWNVSNIKKYSESIRNHKLIYESELLSITDKYNEYIMTGLRTMWGCSFSLIEENFGKFYIDYFKKMIGKWLKTGELVQEGDVIKLSLKGKLIADHISSSLFYT